MTYPLCRLEMTMIALIRTAFLAARETTNLWTYKQIKSCFTLVIRFILIAVAIFNPSQNPQNHDDQGR